MNHPSDFGEGGPKTTKVLLSKSMKPPRSKSPARKSKATKPLRVKGVMEPKVEQIVKLLLESDMPLTLLAEMQRRGKVTDETAEAKEIHEFGERITSLARTHAKRIGSFATDLAMVAEKYGSPSGRGEQVTAAWAALRDTCDDALAVLARELATWVDLRAEKTASTDLLLTATSPIHNSGRLTRAVDRCLELLPEESRTNDGTPSYYAEHVWRLVYHLTELCDRCPEGIRGIAATYPCWPTLQFRHKAGNTDFARLADHIHLGKSSVIEATEVARYHWRTPLNRYVLFTLWRVEGVLDDLKFRPDKPIEEALEWRLGEMAGGERIGVEELPIYEQARTLKPLIKATAKEWADRAIAPLIFVSVPDFSKVPELQETIQRANYNTRACHKAALKTAIRRSLASMAPT